LERPLREICEENGWTLQDLADRTGMGQSTIGNFLKGKTRAGETLLKKLAPVFKTQPDEIDNPQPPEGSELFEGADPSDIWMRRALVAEKQLADIRLLLREILDRPIVSYQKERKKISSAADAAAGELLDAAGESADGSSPK